MSRRLLALWACVRKECLLLWRDLHGLALIFLMPLAFVLIMSIALQGQFAERAGVHLRVVVLDADHSDASRGLLRTLSGEAGFDVSTPAAIGTADALDRQLLAHDIDFTLLIPAGFGAQLMADAGTDTGHALQVGMPPDASKQTETLFLGSLRAALARERVGLLLAAFGVNDAASLTTRTLGAEGIAVHYANTGGAQRQQRPTAVQQSVPAWLVFGAFFIAVPLSNTFIRERQNGTLRRLRATNLGSWTLLAGKLIPYFVVNQLQVLLMLLAGRYLVPLLGGEALRIDAPVWPLAVMSTALSLAALGLALLVAVSSRTSEQATLLSGTGNILLAALGGIMVPKFIMPAALQQVAAYSPMSWGLEGFLDVLLRGGGFHEIAPRAAALTLLGAGSILLAGLVQRASDD